MAKNKTDENVEKVPVPPKADGWEDISITGPQNWHICRAGNTVEGTLKGRFHRPGRGTQKGKYFYRIELDSPTAVMRKEEIDEPAIERQAEKGETICIDERKDLEDLALLCDDGGVYKVRLTPTEKIDLGNGTTFWRFGEKRKRTIKPPTRRPRPIESNRSAEDDTPF